MLEKIKVYSNITNLWSIARRYFVNNFYDGMLTVLGILLGFFVIIVKDGQPPVQSSFVILTGLGSSISMFISGLTGSYLSERAEQKKIKEEIDKAMIISRVEEEEEGDVQEIEKAMLIKISNNEVKKKKRKKKKKRNKTIQDKAESFASIVVSIVNGLSPFLGGTVALIPFFYVPQVTFITFIFSFSIILVCIIFLGVFLGVVSRESIIKNVLQMVVAFMLTLVISFFLLG